MDPLSVTASVVAVLQATNAIISLCYDYRAAIKNSPWALTQIVDEVRDLRNVLETIEQLSSGVERQPSLLLLINSKHSPLTSCLHELSILEQTIGRTTDATWPSKKKIALARAISWKMSENEVKECLARIARCKSTLTLAITADEVTLLQDIRATATVLYANVKTVNHRIDSLVTDLEIKKLDKKHQQFLQWISPVEADRSHKAPDDAYQTNVSSWFISSEAFCKWSDSSNGLLWLSGFPGSGKTTIFSKVVAYFSQKFENPYQEDSAIVASFYCDFRKGKSQDPLSVVGSLVAQVCQQTGSYPAELQQSFGYDQDEDSNLRQPKPPTFTTLRAALKSLSWRRQVILMIDAIEECERRDNLLEYINVLSKNLENVLLFVTSRNESDIQEMFAESKRVRLELHSASINQDLALYIDGRLQSDRRLQRLDPRVKADIAESLKERSGGMFRWVQCQLDSIAGLRTVKAIRNALKELPQGLHETYERILINISPQDAEMARRVLQWLAFATIPLTITEVHTAIAIDPVLKHLDEEACLSCPEDIIDLCGSLISMSAQGRISLAHFSVKDYLLSTDIRFQKPVSVYAMKIEDANHELAVACLSYLAFEEFAEGPAVTSSAYSTRLAKNSMFKHAAIGWAYYFRASTVTLELRNLMFRFFSSKMRSNFMSWVQVLNADDDSDWDFYPRHATSLYYASCFGLTDLVRDSINGGTQLNARGSRFGGTALHGAVLRNHLEVINVLLKAGAEPNRADWNGVTPLHIAVSRSTKEAINLLLNFGAGKDNADRFGATPYGWARRLGRLEAVAILDGT